MFLGELDSPMSTRKLHNLCISYTVSASVHDDTRAVMVLAMIFFLSDIGERLNLALACSEIFNAVDQRMGRTIIKRFLIARMLLQMRCGNMPRNANATNTTGAYLQTTLLLFSSPCWTSNAKLTK